MTENGGHSRAMRDSVESISASFAGHESFPFRHTWLTKGVRYCAENPSIFKSKDAMAILGVGKNMVRSIRHWCLASRMIREDSKTENTRGRWLRPTDLGARIFIGHQAWDPFLEDIGTLWLIHWKLVTNAQRATTWHFAFSRVHQPEFSRLWMEISLMDFAQRLKNFRATRNTLRRDIEVFIRTYVRPHHYSSEILEESFDCPLVELNLVRHLAVPNNYGFNRGRKVTLPDEIFVHAIGDYILQRPGIKTLAFDELAYGIDSPGRVFKLDEFSLGERLERVDALTHGSWHFSETAGLKQLVISKSFNPMRILEHYYRYSTSTRMKDGDKE